jgi:2-polyprenyl-6-hydroxyphenyl methylase/3-demethylubiquinone-9 3-methyltransferase
METKKSTIDPAEVEQFSRIAQEWWNPRGKFKPLHDINPVRLEWILEKMSVGLGAPSAEHKQSAPRSTQHAAPLRGLNLLDIGCGGGLMCEPLARLGANVTGIDASEKNIAVATLHAEQSGLAIDYECITAEALLSRITNHESPTTPLFDVVLALEIVEHVADVALFVQSCCALMRPGGLIIFSTINRTPMSYLKAIIGAEYVLRLLPRGTHDWQKFLKPSELCREMTSHGITIEEMTGMVLDPLRWEWRINPKDLSVNYLVCGKKAER